MSGTSLDGVDAALIATDGRQIAGEEYEGCYQPFDDELREWLLNLCRASADNSIVMTPLEILRIERDYSLFNAKVVAKLLAKNGLSPKQITAIGFHGQTICHYPDEGISWQIGNGALLATKTGISVVNNFRTMDLVLGGQGAPLAPIYHFAKLQSHHKAGNRNIPNLQLPCAIVNIGGIANITYIPNLADETKMIAFDTGPGNGIIDDWVLANGRGQYDSDGGYAAQGQRQDEIVARYLQDPYNLLPAPKSLDRNYFSISTLLDSNYNFYDVAHSLAMVTVEYIVDAMRFLPELPKSWVICGGGVHNDFMMAKLQNRLNIICGNDIDFFCANDIGWDSELFEAECFAFLAARRLAGLDISFSGTTGCNRSNFGGVVHNHI